MANDPSIWTPEGVKAALDRFRAKADEFTALYNKMRAYTPEQRAKLPPDLQNKLGAILGKAETVKVAVTGVRDKFNAAIEWIKDVTGMNGSQLSAVPIVIAGYVAAVVGVTWVIGNTVNEMRTIDKQAELILAGKNPNALRVDSTVQQLGKNLVWPAVILVALWIVPKLLDER